MATPTSDLERLLERWRRRGGDDARTAALVALAEVLPELPPRALLRVARAAGTKQAQETLKRLPDLRGRLATAFAARAADLDADELDAVLGALGPLAPRVVLGLAGHGRSRGLALLRRQAAVARTPAASAEALADLAEAASARERRSTARAALGAAERMRPGARRVVLLARLVPLLARRDAAEARTAALADVERLRPGELPDALAALLPVLPEAERSAAAAHTRRLRRAPAPRRLAQIGDALGDEGLAADAIRLVELSPPQEQPVHAGQVSGALGGAFERSAVDIALSGISSLRDPFERALGLERLSAASSRIALRAPLLRRANVRATHLVSATARRARPALAGLEPGRREELAAQVAELAAAPSPVAAPPRAARRSAGRRPPLPTRPSPSRRVSGLERPRTRAGRRPRRYVSTGFAAGGEAASPLARTTPLDPDVEYLFWLQVGARVRGSIEEMTVELEMPSAPGTRLEVAIFGFHGGLAPVGERTGALVVRADGAVVVARPAATPRLPERWAAGLSRLFFRVRTPAAASRAQLRCNIYCNGLLLQSRVVTAAVGTARAQARALRSTLDYALSRSLADGHVGAAPAHALSVLVNGGATGTHELRIAFDDGTTLQPDDVSIEPESLDALLGMARDALRSVTWNTPDEPPPEAPYPRYRYARRVDETTLKDDLASLAKTGVRLWDELIGQLAGGQKNVDRLTDRLVRPAAIQLASRGSPRFVLPAALFYDYPGFRAMGAADEYELCDGFRAALARGSADGWACLDGACPARGATHTVCPSGFWGFRHRLGFPPSAKADVAFVAAASQSRVAGINPTLADAARHAKELEQLGGSWQVAHDVERVIALLKSTRLDLAYFYCHGGVEKNVPYLQFGREDDDGFSAADVRQNRIAWQQPGPLVFINGCRTAALAPRNVLDLVSRFVDVGGATGVIGTEITIYESLAGPFAVRVLGPFLRGTLEVGEAVRRARIEALVKDGNPLALAYVPFVVAGLKLEPRIDRG